jgi:hypothetical protein
LKTNKLLPTTGVIATCAIVLGSLFPSCEDQAQMAGLDLMPELDYFVPMYDDKTTMTSENILFPFRVDDAFNGVIGEYEDPLFGSVKSDFMVQMIPDSISTVKKTYKDASNKTTATEVLELEGLYLHFPLIEKSWLGDSAAVHSVKIYELKDDLNEEKYYADMSVDNLYYTNPLAVKEVKASAGYSVKSTKKVIVDGVEKDSVSFGWDKSAEWKLKLSNEVANRFWELALTPPFNPSSTNEIERTKFLNYFKGVYVSSDLVDPSKKSLIPVGFVSSTPLKLVLNFKRTKITTTVATGDTTHTITKESRNYKTSLERKRITRPVSLSSGSIPEDNGAPQNLFIQGMSGRGARIALDEAQINRWKDSLQQGNRHVGFSNVELSFFIDKGKKEFDTKTDAPMANLQIWMKNKGGEMTDKPLFVCGQNSGYVFQTLSASGVPVPTATLSADTVSYTFKLNIYYLDAYLHFLNDPNNEELFLKESGKYYAFTEKNPDGSYKYIYDMDELLLMPATGDMSNTSISVANTMKRVVLKSPENTDDPTKLKIKYFAY